MPLHNPELEVFAGGCSFCNIVLKSRLFVFCIFAWTCATHSAHAGVRWQLARVISFLTGCGFQALNSGHQSWWQELYPLRYCAIPTHFVIFPTHLSHCATWYAIFLSLDKPSYLYSKMGTTYTLCIKHIWFRKDCSDCRVNLIQLISQNNHISLFCDEWFCYLTSTCIYIMHSSYATHTPSLISSKLGQPVFIPIDFFAIFMTDDLFCIPQSLSRAVCVTLVLEMFIRAWWADQWAHSCMQFLSFSQNLLVANSSAVSERVMGPFQTTANCWVGWSSVGTVPVGAAVVSLWMPWPYHA